MQLSSKEPFNDDPYPTYPPGGHPMYNRHPNNPTNPILTDFRELHQSTGNDLWTDAYLSWENLLEEWESHPLEQWHHAMDVLGKITRIYKGTKE